MYTSGDGIGRCSIVGWALAHAAWVPPFCISDLSAKGGEVLLMDRVAASDVIIKRQVMVGRAMPAI